MKKQVLDGRTLIPEKIFGQKKCDFCQKHPKTNILYPFKIDELNKWICYKCIDEKRKQSAHQFTYDDEVHIGTKKHRCGYGKNMFCSQIGAFTEKNGRIKYIKIYQCNKCGAYIVDAKSYEKNFALFNQYNLFDTKSGKPIIKFVATERSLRPKQREELEAPAHIQWAVKHPYQGGGFSGK